MKAEGKSVSGGNIPVKWEEGIFVHSTSVHLQGILKHGSQKYILFLNLCVHFRFAPWNNGTCCERHHVGFVAAFHHPCQCNSNEP